jgi:hypothetical protein
VPASDSLEVEQAGGRTDKRGQFVLAVDDYRHNPDDLFASAQAAEQAGDIAEAERLYRLLTKGCPTDLPPKKNDAANGFSNQALQRTRSQRPAF